jgi:DNA-binding transcriptional LysR family regulator
LQRIAALHTKNIGSWATNTIRKFRTLPSELLMEPSAYAALQHRCDNDAAELFRSTGVEFYQLKAFVAVAAEGQLTRAADRLHLSQPAVSAQIRALEDELAQQLFTRSAGGMALTAAGRDLLSHAERVLTAADSLRSAARALQPGLNGKLKIGTLSDPDFIRLGDFLARTVERYPEVEIELHNGMTSSAFEAVNSGELDASFYFGPLHHASVSGLALREIAYRVAAPSKWTKRIRNAGWAKMASLPWILPPESSSLNHLARDLFRKEGLTLAKTIEADNESVIANLVTSEVGLSLLREDLALTLAESGKVAIWNFGGNFGGNGEGTRLTTTLWFIYQTERAQEPVLEALLNTLAETWQTAVH